MDEKAYIPLGTKSKCTMGSSENLLNLPLDHGVAYTPEGKPLLNANDHVPGQHILPYGLCKITKLPCMPVTPLAWTIVNKHHILDGAPALLDESLLTCVIGGVISIVPPEKGSAEKGEKSELAADKVESRSAAQEPSNNYVGGRRGQYMATTNSK